MDLQTMPGWLAIPLAIYGIYLQRTQVKLMTARDLPRAARRRGDVPRAAWATPLTFVMVALVLLAWISRIVSQFGDKPLIEKAFGPYQSTIDPSTRKFTAIELFVYVDGNELLRYSDSYKMVGIAFHNYGNEDPDNISDLQKSAEYYIHSGNQQLLIPVSKQFLEEVNRGDRMTTYALVLMPDDLSVNDITTLHHAKEIGAKVFGIGAGPP